MPERVRLPAPVCPVCQWMLVFAAEHDAPRPDSAPDTVLWQAYCPNPHCPDQDAGNTPVAAGEETYRAP